jgi:hypothetical protein
LIFAFGEDIIVSDCPDSRNGFPDMASCIEIQTENGGNGELSNVATLFSRMRTIGAKKFNIIQMVLDPRNLFSVLCASK